MFAWGPRRPEEGIRASLQLDLQAAVISMMWDLELNLGPLEEQQGLLTAESPLQSLIW